MFCDYLVPEYSEDVNDIAIQKAKNSNKPIIVFGCGESGRQATELLKKYEAEIEVYCEGEQFWHEGKRFMGKDVVKVSSLVDLYEKAAIIVAATGPEVISIINGFHKDQYEIYAYVVRDQLYTMSPQWVFENKDNLQKTFEMFEDETSKITFLSYIGTRANCIKREATTSLLSLWTSKQYFNDLYPRDRFQKHVLIDCGAWIGDSASEFMQYIGDGDTEKNITIHSFEMEDENYEHLLKVAARYPQIVCHKCGVGDEHMVMYFTKSGDSSTIVDYPTDHKVEIFPVDEVLKGNHVNATFVKMDIEGFEDKALCGMKNLVKESFPMLAICVYHKLDDLIRIPNLIRDMVSDPTGKVGYKYYLRHHSHNAAELVFYAVPYDNAN